MDIFTQGGRWEGNGRISKDHMVFNFRENGKGDHSSPTEYKRGGGGLQKIDRQSNAHNKMGGRGIRISPPPPPHHGTKFTLSSCNICLGFAPERHS